MWAQALAWRKGGVNYRDIAGRFARNPGMFGLVELPSEDTVRREIKRRQASEAPDQQVVVASVRTDADRAPAQDRGVVHRELVRSAGNRLRGALAGLPPVPSDLIHGGAGAWWDAEAAVAQIAGDGQLQTLRRHAAGSDFPQAIQQFFDRLMPYPAAAQNAMKSVEVAIRTRIPHSVSTAAAGLFCQAVDRACVASAEHRGSWDSAQDEFQHLTMMGPHVKETGGVYEVTMGLYVAARLNSFEQSEVAATVLGELASDLWDSSEIRALAEAYFDLLGLRRELVEHLSPVAVDKWAVDGRCVWCPAPG